MTTTVTINLAGYAFNIDDNAYQTLQAYLKSIEKNLGVDTDKKEVMQDIEARIAELFNDMRRRQQRDVISLDMVQAVMQQLGAPDEFRDEDADTQTEEKPEQKPFFRKKMYRDPDNKIISGVCAGLGHYFGIGAIWVRIIFLLCLLLWGITLPIYIILWLVMPEARTAAQRLDMRGEDPTIENIEREIALGNSNQGSPDGCLTVGLKIIIWCVGAFFLLIALFVFFILLTGIGAALTTAATTSSAGLAHLLFAHGHWLTTLFALLTAIVIALPVCGIIIALVNYIRKGESVSKKSLWLWFFVWLVALFGSIAIGGYELANNDDIRQALFSDNDCDDNLEYYADDIDDDIFDAEPLSLDAFHSVEVNGAVDITLAQAEEQYTALLSRPPKGFKTEVRDSVLYITAKKKGAKLFLQMPQTHSLAFHGAAKCNTQERIICRELKIDASGASDLNLNLQTETLDINTAGASEIELQGTARRLKMDVAGASDVDAEEFVAQVVDANAMGASKIKLNVTDSLTVHGSGVSKIEYIGDPVVYKSLHGGRLKQIQQ